MANYGMPVANQRGYGQMPANAQPSTPPQPMYGNQQNQMMFPAQGGMQQPYQPILPTLSIAPVSGEENAMQFPVAVGTELYLIDKANGMLYMKSNSSNPRDMLKFRLEQIIEEPNQNEPVSRAELDEMKNMMAQMMAMIQNNQSPKEEPQQPQQQKSYGKRREDK